MTTFAIFIFATINILVAVKFYTIKDGVFQYPFLFSCVNIAFVLPQMSSIISSGSCTVYEIAFSLCVYISCTVGLVMGYLLGQNSRIKLHNHHPNINFSFSLVLMFAVGAVASILNRGAYKGGFVSGTYVVINFFTSFLTYSLISFFILHHKSPKYKRLALFFIFIGVLIVIDEILSSGRRAESIFLFLVCSRFLFLNSITKYSKYKWVVPAFFIVGTMANTQISQYRNNAYDESVSFMQNVQSLDFKTSSKDIGTNSHGEIYNSFKGIIFCLDNNAYDYGLYNWNGAIRDFLPKSIIGEWKNKLLYRTKSSSLTSRLTASGSTMTGYYDAFSSFSIFAFVKFLLVGFCMGRVWMKALNNDFYKVLYWGTLVPALHLITHSSCYFFNSIVFFILFVLPFFITCKYKVKQ